VIVSLVYVTFFILKYNVTVGTHSWMCCSNDKANANLVML